MYNAYVGMYVGLCVHKPANVFALMLLGKLQRQLRRTSLLVDGCKCYSALLF